MTNKQLLPILLLPLLIWRVYMRIARNVGRQPLRPGRAWTGIAVFGAVTLLVAAVGIIHPPILVGLGAGLLLGVPLAFAALKLTRFEQTSEGIFYTPNKVIGVALSVLLVVRLFYRFSELFGQIDGSVRPPFDVRQIALTLVFFGLIAGYYLTYNAGLLVRGKKQSA